MLENLTSSVILAEITPLTMLLCTACSVLLGMGVAALFMIQNRFSKGFVLTLALLPAIVQVCIMMVNGSIGAGIAVAGTFSLVRFRSVPGTAREIGSIFFAMAIGLATGMGYLFYAFLFFLLVGLFYLALTLSGFGGKNDETRNLRITIPEDLDYDGVFDQSFAQFTHKAALQQVKTTNMGSLYELSYQVVLKDTKNTKAFLDDLRCRNGNLRIILARPAGEKDLL